MSALTSLALREAIRQKFAWPGGYAIVGICSDGGVLCCDCMRAEYKQIANARRHRLNDGWRVEAITTTECEDAPIDCDHCGKAIE